MAMIRRCNHKDFEIIRAVINEAAKIYKGVIPADRWKIPYMSEEELKHEINAGVEFWGYEADGRLTGVMAIQPVQDVTLIRHAYVHPERQNQGIGTKLLIKLCTRTDRPILIGTWAAAVWAIRFYKKHGFRRVSPQEKTRLLEKYWSIRARQVETSVVLADQKWFDRQRKTKCGVR